DLHHAARLSVEPGEDHVPEVGIGSIGDEVAQFVVGVVKGPIQLIAQAQVEGQAQREFPIVLHIQKVMILERFGSTVRSVEYGLREAELKIREAGAGSGAGLRILCVAAVESELPAAVQGSEGVHLHILVRVAEFEEMGSEILGSRVGKFPNGGCLVERRIAKT